MYRNAMTWASRAGYSCATLAAVMYALVLLAPVSAADDHAPDESVVVPGAEMKLLAGGFDYTEGPAADDLGGVYFTDPHANRLLYWTPEGSLMTVMDPSFGPIGLYLGRDGRLLVAAGYQRRVISTDVHNYTDVTVLADSYGGGRLNEPNDLWQDDRGGIYFTDPYWRDKTIEQDGQHVYYITPGGTVVRVVDDMTKPNGIHGSPDGSVIYIVDTREEKTYAFDAAVDGTLSGKRLFAERGGDGMTVDTEGRVYLTGDGIAVYRSDGAFVESIDVPERVSNVCFGGYDSRTLFITTRTSLYSLRMRSRGLPR